MIKRVLNSKLPAIIYNPPGVFDYNWFAAACEAGALPVLDTEFLKISETFAVLEKLKTDKVLFGIRIFFCDEEIIDFLNRNNIINLDLVVLAYKNREEIRSNSLSGTFYKVLLETRDTGLGSLINNISPHGLILKGNEAPGLVSRETSFILMQWYLKYAAYPLFIHGGVGMHTAAGMFAAGVNGIVLDNQLYLTDEYMLADEFRELIRDMEENDTFLLDDGRGNCCRISRKPVIKRADMITEKKNVCAATGCGPYGETGSSPISVNPADTGLLRSPVYLGQDALFAGHFVAASAKLKDVLHRLFRHTGECLEAVDDYDPLAAVFSQACNPAEPGAWITLYTAAALSGETGQKDCRGFLLAGSESGDSGAVLSGLVLWELIIEKISSCSGFRQTALSLLFPGRFDTEYAFFLISGMTSILAKQEINICLSAENLYDKEAGTQAVSRYPAGYQALLHAHLNSLEIFSEETSQINDEIAVIGMGCLFPDAGNCGEFWQNIVAKRYSIAEIPLERFNHEIYCSTDRKADDKGYSKIAGYLKNYQFDHKKYGYTKEEGDSLSRSQQIILDAAFQAVEAAGYTGSRSLPSGRTAVIIASCSSNEMYNNLNFKYFYPEVKYYLEQSPAFRELDDGQKDALLKEIKSGMTGNLKSRIPVDSLINVEASRVARHLGITGSHYCIDAACASSLAVIDCAVKSLLSGEYDYIVAGGLNTNFAPETLVGFSKIHALSDTGSYPFDERANGFVIGEGAGVLLLKRMKEAVRDRDNILGIIKSVGGSSDGKGKAVAAPQAKGQELAIRRCYEKIKSGLTLNDMQFIEAHGTATKVGDATEIESLSRVITGSAPVGISSIKSQIGHLLGGAGIAGMIKVLLAMKNRILPPNGLFEQLSSAYELPHPLYIVKDPQAWEVPAGISRKAGISSYGFGGINYHICMEEYTAGYKKLQRCIFSDPDYNFNDKRIVVAGMGCVLPGSHSVEEFWNNLVAAKPLFSVIPEQRFHNAAYAMENDPEFRLPVVKAGVITDYVFDYKKYRFPPVRLVNIERTQLYALDAATQAVEQAYLQPLLTDGNKVAVIIGNSMAGEKTIDNIMRVRLNLVRKIIHKSGEGSHGQREKIAAELTQQLTSRYPRNNENTVPGLLPNIISSRISNFFNCTSVNFTVDAASVSAAVAASVGIKGLMNGEYDFVISGGSHSNFSPGFLAGLDLTGLLSRDENRIFDKKADGVNPGEGAVVYVLTTCAKARKHNMPCYAELQDFSCSSGIKPQRLVIPEHEQYSSAMKNFYQKSPIIPGQVNYLEICGLSNLSSDTSEYRAINRQFRHILYYGNMKPATGYLFAANPALVILKLILMNRHRMILPNWYHTKATSIITGKSVLKSTSSPLTFNHDSPFNLAMNFYGFGGNHVHGMVHSLPSWLETPEAAKNNVMRKETPVISRSMESEPITRKKTGKIAVLLSGQGAQEAGMMRDLYNFDETIHFVMDEGDKIFRQIRGYSLLDIIFNNEQLLNLTINTQPAIFLSSAAIFNSLRNKELKPNFFIGHSLGEFTALYCAGILDFKEALKLVIKRSDIMHHTAISKPGSMVALFRNADDTRKLIQKSKLHFIYIANTNSENQTVVSGENYKIDQFIEFLKQESESFKKINVSAAFHTPLFKSASKELADYLDTVQFNNADYSAVFSNVTGTQYPPNEKQVKKLLEKQMISTVEFVESIKNACRMGVEYFIEIGPKQVLSRMVDNIDVNYIINLPAVYQMYGEVKSFNKLTRTLSDLEIIRLHKAAQERMGHDIIDKSYFNELHLDENDFSQFIAESREQVNHILYQEYMKYKKQKDEKKLEKLEIYAGDIVVSGVSVGLPGSKHSVFNRNNFDEIITGTNYIESLSFTEKRKILDKNIPGTVKGEDSETGFQDIKTIDEAMHQAGRLGYFDLKKEYGIEGDFDITCSLAIAAGFEALKDANIPLVIHNPPSADDIPRENEMALPSGMQEKTGVIFTTFFPGIESLIEEVGRYHKDKVNARSLSDLESFYAFFMANIKDQENRKKFHDWYEKAVRTATTGSRYELNSNLLVNAMAMGAAHFARLIRARGPNTQLSSTSASTTQAICLAEDWIRANRCDRVIIISSDAPTSGVLNEWIGAGFLAVGTAGRQNRGNTVSLHNREGAGIILGSGAAALIIEKEEEVKKRGMNGQAQVLGTYMGNLLFSETTVDSGHLSVEMKKFLNKMEKTYNLKREIYTRTMLYLSNEIYSDTGNTYAEAEYAVLKSAFPNEYQNIVVANTREYTGDTLGTSIEDVVLIKSLQKHRAPAVANPKGIPEIFRELKFSAGRIDHYEYGLHMDTGPGPQFCFLFLKRREENLVQGNEQYQRWLSTISGRETAVLMINRHILCMEAELIPFPGAESGGKGKNGHRLIDDLKEIIADQTGYSVEMLEENLEFEADLGIDTVKQVQIFGKVSCDFGFEVPENLKLNKLNTINKLAHFVEEVMPAGHMAEAESNGECSVKQEIKRVISSQTGYTPDMLAEDLDFEADLGIDTVKQVQIFGNISDCFGLEVPEDIKFSRMNTITKLEQFVMERIQAGENSKTETGRRHTQTTGQPVNTPFAGQEGTAIRRYTFTAEKAALPDESINIFKDRTFLITVDEWGFARELAGNIIHLGGKTITAGTDSSCDIVIDFNNITDIEALTEKITGSLPEIHGLIHFLPLNYYFRDISLSPESIQLSVKFLFLLIKNLFHRLNHKECLISVLSLNSLIFPCPENSARGRPVFAGLSGMLKSLKCEMPETRIKAVDFHDSCPLDNIAAVVRFYLQELMSGDGQVETGYRGGERYILSRIQEEPAEGESLIRNGDTLLVAGGARGITFEIIKALTARYRLKLLILGRSDIFSINQKYGIDVQNDSFPDENRIMLLLKEKMKRAKPVALKRTANEILNARKTLLNIRLLKSSGAEVEYFPVDVLDYQALKNVVGDYKPIDGIIFAAGVEESELVHKKTLASFNKVFDTKVMGMQNLLNALKPYNYRYLIAFSSAAARFGNAAQTDYTAANGALGKIIEGEKMLHPARLYKVFDWTAWEGTGMAARESVQRVLKAGGTCFLSIQEGIDYFLREMHDQNALEIMISQ